jgi:hypothetical protein
MSKYEIKLDHICEVVAYVSAPVPVGRSSWGTRLFFPVIGEDGYVNGPKLQAKIRPLGEDAALIRIDNCFELNVRIVLETNDNAMIYASYGGVIDMTQEEVNRFLGGELPPNLKLFTTPRFETGHENYQWLTRIQAVGRGSVEPEGDRFKVSYSWYGLTA